MPHRMPVVYRLIAYWVAFAGIGFLVWWLAPHGPVLIALLVVYVLVAVFGGVWRILLSRELNEPPGRHPRPR